MLTVAIDRNLDLHRIGICGFDGQISAVPHVDQAKLDDCLTGIGALIANTTTNAFIGLDGSRSACEWGEDADSPEGTTV